MVSWCDWRVQQKSNSIQYRHTDIIWFEKMWESSLFQVNEISNLSRKAQIQICCVHCSSKIGYIIIQFYCELQKQKFLLERKSIVAKGHISKIVKNWLKNAVEINAFTKASEGLLCGSYKLDFWYRVKEGMWKTSLLFLGPFEIQ